MLNLGKAFDSVQRLHSSSDWQAVVAALHEQMSHWMHTACEDGNPKTSGYAQGLRDVLWAFENAENKRRNPDANAVPKPLVARRPVS